MTLSLRKTRQQVSRSPYRAQVTRPPMVINPIFKDVLNQLTCPQVQVFFFMKNYEYLQIKFIQFPCNMKYET